MKQEEFTPCASCGDGVAKTGVHFYRVKVEQFVLDHKAISRQAGLEQFLVSPILASAFSLGEDMAISFGEATVLICGSCGVSNSLPIACLLEGGDE